MKSESFPNPTKRFGSDQTQILKTGYNLLNEYRICSASAKESLYQLNKECRTLKWGGPKEQIPSCIKS